MANEKNKPVIGISSIEVGNFDGWFETFHMHQCRADACHAVWKAGGVPMILPAMPDQKCIEQYFNSIDGLFITGGYDVLPFIYGEDMHENCGAAHPMTDRFDVLLIREAMRRKLPMICVCRGLQITNVIYGGTIYQDLKSEKAGVYIKHHAPQQGNMFVHKLKIEDKESLFTKITGVDEELYVNSIHHQGLKELAPIFKPVARSADDVIEIVELRDKDHFFLGMQFHPEILVNHGVVAMLGIFKSLVNASVIYKESE